MSGNFAFFTCTSAECRLRFPAAFEQLPTRRCPRCNAPLTVDNKQLRGELNATASGLDNALLPKAWRVELLLDNVRSALNVGSILRTADGAGVKHVHLCGITPPGDHAGVIKTALGAEQSAPWTHARNAIDVAHQLRDADAQLWALECTSDARPIAHAASAIAAGARTVLIAGNERAGVDPALLALCEGAVALPMRGAKESLNVAVAVGAALYVLRALTTDDG